jgi:hypothetical protein
MNRPLPLLLANDLPRPETAKTCTGWQNPQPDGVYNLVVIGAGTAGLVCAAGAAASPPAWPDRALPAVMERMRRLRAGISTNHSAARFAGRSAYLPGPHVLHGRRQVEMDGRTLRFDSSFITH